MTAAMGSTSSGNRKRPSATAGAADHERFEHDRVQAEALGEEARGLRIRKEIEPQRIEQRTHEDGPAEDGDDRDESRDDRLAAPLCGDGEREHHRKRKHRPTEEPEAPVQVLQDSEERAERTEHEDRPEVLQEGGARPGRPQRNEIHLPMVTRASDESPAIMACPRSGPSRFEGGSQGTVGSNFRDPRDSGPR